MASFETFESDVSEKQFMEAAVNSLLKEGDEFCDEVEKCFDEKLDECNLLKTYNVSIALRSVNLKVDSLGTQERNTLIKNQKRNCHRQLIQRS